MRIPEIPENVSITGNMDVARRQRYALQDGSAFLYSWFYKQVRNRGPWDYKQLSSRNEAFGNFNYGAAGTAAGIPSSRLLRAAGMAQTAAGTSRPEFGSWWRDAPYGDDPNDQYWIKQGIAYARSKGF